MIQHPAPVLTNEFRQTYFEDTAGCLPATVLVTFQKEIKQDLSNILAVDLGAGALADARWLLNKGVKQLIAIDGSPSSQKYISQNIEPHYMNKFSRQQQTLEDLHLPPNQLLFSNKALSLVDPLYFSDMMKNVTDSIEPGGYFVGNFFGEWCNANFRMVKLTVPEIELLFPDFTILYTNTRSGRVHCRARDAIEHREIHDIIAQKK